MNAQLAFVGGQSCVQRNCELESAAPCSVTAVPSGTVVLNRHGAWHEVDGSMRISPPPPASTLASTETLASFTKVTAAARSRSIRSSQSGRDPVQSPDHAAIVHSASAVASTWADGTVSPTSKVTVQGPAKQKLRRPPPVDWSDSFTEPRP